MAAVNSIINQTDYNTIRDKIVNVMGNGSATYGYGQTAKILSSAVTPSNKVSANDWGKLRYDIINAYNHIYGTLPTVASVDEGYTIRYSNTFVPDTGPSPSSPSKTDAPVTQYDVWANDIVANRFSVGSGQFILSSPTTQSTTFSNLVGYWSVKISCTVQITFSNADQARYFFNSGGEVRIALSRTNPPSPATPLGVTQTSRWSSLLSSAGTRSFGSQTPTSGFSPMNGQNWYRTTSTDQLWYSLSDTSPYGGNSVRIYSRTNVSNNSSGTANIGYFLIELVDGYTDPGGPPPGDQVDGVFTVDVSLKSASGLLYPSGTGNFSVTNPTISITSFSGS